MVLPSSRSLIKQKKPNPTRKSNQEMSIIHVPHPRVAIKSAAIGLVGIDPETMMLGRIVGIEIETAIVIVIVTTIAGALRKIEMDGLARVTENEIGPLREMDGAAAAARNERAARDLDRPNATEAREGAETIVIIANGEIETETEIIHDVIEITIETENGVLTTMISETWTDALAMIVIVILLLITTTTATTIGVPGWEVEDLLHLRCNAEEETLVGAIQTLVDRRHTATTTLHHEEEGVIPACTVLAVGIAIEVLLLGGTAAVPGTFITALPVGIQAPRTRTVEGRIHHPAVGIIHHPAFAIETEEDEEIATDGNSPAIRLLGNCEHATILFFSSSELMLRTIPLAFLYHLSYSYIEMPGRPFC